MRVGGYTAEVPGAAFDAGIGSHKVPRGAPIVRTVKAGWLGIDCGINAHATRHRDTRAAPFAIRQAVSCKLLPRGPAIRGFIKSAARAAIGRILAPRRTPRVPRGGIDNLCILRFEAQIDRSHIRPFIEHLAPCRAAIARAEYTALRIRPV